MRVKNTTIKDKEPPPKFNGRFKKDGGLEFGPYIRVALKNFIKANPGMPFELLPVMPESNKQRRFFEGAICPLVVFYQEGMDHHNNKDIEKVRDWLKMEFNAELVEIGGKIHKIAKSTKNRLNQGFLDRVMDYIMDNYNPPNEAVDPNKYKYWKDVVFPYGGPENYIDYLLELKLLRLL